MYCVLNDVFEYPKCYNSNCNTILRKFLGFKEGYKRYCSSKCVATDKNILMKKKKTNLKKYGTEHPMQSIEVKTKKEKTNLKKYGAKTPLQNHNVKERIKETKLERYGDENYNNQLKRFNTCIEKYGVKHPWMLEEVQERRKQTMIKRYGDDNPSKIKMFKDKKTQTHLERYGVTHFNKTQEAKEIRIKENIEKYGVKHPWMLEEVQERRKQTMIKRYGVQNITYKHMTQEQINILNNKSYFEKYSVRELIEMTNTSQPTISKYMIKHGITHGFKSKAEKEIYDYVCSIYKGEVIYNKRDLGTELDIYVPEFNFAIEYNGAYWHSTYFKERQFHYKKFKTCMDSNVKLLQFFDFDWNDDNKREILKSKIKLSLNIFDEKIYARKCIIKEVDVKTSSKFLENNHLEGNAKSNIKLGLYYNNELVSLMTFGKSRFKEDEYELVRFVSKKNIIVVGGASKLFKYFIKTYNINNLISYSNNFYSNGSLYKMLGFEYIQSNIGYFYYKNKTKYNRIQFQKHKLKSKLIDFNESLSEFENMDNNGYLKINDAGQTKWIFKNV